MFDARSKENMGSTSTIQRTHGPEPRSQATRPAVSVLRRCPAEPANRPVGIRLLFCQPSVTQEADIRTSKGIGARGDTYECVIRHDTAKIMLKYMTGD